MVLKDDSVTIPIYENGRTNGAILSFTVGVYEPISLEPGNDLRD